MESKTSNGISFSGCYQPSSLPQTTGEALLQQTFKLLFKLGQVCRFIPSMHVHPHFCRGKPVSKIDVRTAPGNKRESPNHNDCSEKDVWISFISTRMASRYSQSLTGRTEDNVSPFTELLTSRKNKKEKHFRGNSRKYVPRAPVAVKDPCILPSSL